MTVSGLDGVDPMRSAALTSATAGAGATGAALGVPGAVGAPAPVGQPPRTPQRQPQGPGFENPELKSGLLSDNITPVQREGLGRLSRLLRMQPRELLDSLRSGTGLGLLLSAKRLLPSALIGMFDKGLLIDAEA